MGPTEIRQLILRSKSTVSRETRRLGTGQSYEARPSHEAALALHTMARRRPRGTPVRLREIIAGLRLGQSPQQIAGRWEQEGRRAEERLSYEAIYQIIRLVRLVFLRNKEADGVAAALERFLSGEVVQSLTYDRGLEWMRHERIAKALGAVSYFCLPYHPWEKGAVEQMNGLIRRYLLKAESFAYEEADHYWLELIEGNLNTRPRRVLGYRTPLEMARELTGLS